MTPTAQSTALTTEAADAIGRQVIEIEIAGLRALLETLDQRFVKAVETMFQASGRVVVCGIGKSGHVARKIAATLASTGTPAFFVHPAEASHGDLGMIAPGDAVICLSASGNTAELADIVAYTRRFSIPLVAIVGKADSALGRAADIVLLLPPVAEACSMGLAPTTSTTLMMVLGDALAIALLERRGFSREQFKIFHPGGNLGRRLVKVADIMHVGDALPLITTEKSMSDAIIVMSEKSFGCVGVLDGSGRLAGVVTDGDLRRHMGSTLLSRPVAEVMTRNPKSIDPNALAQEALARMTGSITSLFVVDGNGFPQGLVHIHDCLRAGIV